MEFNGALQLAGGLGLFLLGMSVMTDGLRGVAGEALHRALSRFTRNAPTGVLSGALVTAVLQSSSATTVAAVGFVSAGLLTFVQALGVIFGANLGTTVTGWLVALLGLKLNIGTLSMPLILLGALARFVGRPKWASAGTALAGFGLIFVGISLLQEGMAGLQGQVTPEVFPDDTLSGRLLLILIGIAITVITQSSSAGVATALTAVYTGAIDFPQAAALVIGMNVGTTITAVVATIGGSAETRRTGYSHVMFNVVTALGALLLLDAYAWAWDAWAPSSVSLHAEITLVAFHTSFNLLGVLLILPFTTQFAGLMYRLVPEEHAGASERLNKLLLKEPALALDAAAGVARSLVQDTTNLLQKLLSAHPPEHSRWGERLVSEAVRLQAYVDDIHLLPEQTRAWIRLNALIHLLDHLQRLLVRLNDDRRRQRALAQFVLLAEQVKAFELAIGQCAQALFDQADSAALTVSSQHAAQLAEVESALRSAITADMALGRISIPQGTQRMDAVRWLTRMSEHVARIFYHLNELNSPADKMAGKMSEADALTAPESAKLDDPRTNTEPPN